MLRSVLCDKYNVQKGGENMKTAEEIIAYLEAEMNEAIDLHDQATDNAQRLSLMLKAYTISELLDVIKDK
jgi:uncharacterized tellurite resistance protein B-like protein